MGWGEIWHGGGDLRSPPPCQISPPSVQRVAPAMKFADYFLENYIAVDSKFPLTLWANPPDLLIPYTNNGAE